MSLERAKTIIEKGDKAIAYALEQDVDHLKDIALETTYKTSIIASAHALVSIAESLHEISQTLGNMDLRSMQ